jgi:hypothetical protein
VGETPFAALDVMFFRDGDFQQVTDGGGQHVLVGFKVLIVLGKAAQRLRDVVRDRRLLGDDEGFVIFCISFLTLWGRCSMRIIHGSPRSLHVCALKARTTR